MFDLSGRTELVSARARAGTAGAHSAWPRQGPRPVTPEARPHATRAADEQAGRVALGPAGLEPNDEPSPPGAVEHAAAGTHGSRTDSVRPRAPRHRPPRLVTSGPCAEIGRKCAQRAPEEAAPRARHAARVADRRER